LKFGRRDYALLRENQICRVTPAPREFLRLDISKQKDRLDEAPLVEG
jgi:hypothetical protein